MRFGYILSYIENIILNSAKNHSVTVNTIFQNILDKYPQGVYNIITDTPPGYLKGDVIMKCDKHCAGCTRHTVRTDEQKKSLLNRLKRIEGQIRGIQAMIERDAYCNDILTQSAAVNAAVSAFNKEILTNHLHTCIIEDIKNGNDEIMDELIATLQKIIK